MEILSPGDDVELDFCMNYCFKKPDQNTFS